MKFKKITGKDVSANLPTLVGAGAGVMVARGISGAYAKTEAGAVLTEDQKKKKLHAAIASVVVGAVGLMAIDGKDTTAEAAKGLSVGIAVNGVLDVVSHFAQKSAPTIDQTTVTGKFVANALGCACNATQSVPYQLNRPYRRRSSLNMPEFVQPVQTDLASLAPSVSDLAQLAMN